ncbi:MAG: hypothetical protein ACXAC7_01540 [Candidatus Hodarchaeales archaeon]|jgi:hypothetical protein
MNEHNSEQMKSKPEKLKNITIRGIDAKYYEEFSHAMKILNMNMGDAVTKMMKDVLSDFDETFPDLSAKSFVKSKELPRASINHHDSLTISESDLLDANVRFSIAHCEIVEFSPDIKPKTFSRHIRSVSHCDEVRIPSILPKLLVYSKIQFCDNIEVFDVDKNNQETESENKEVVS